MSQGEKHHSDRSVYRALLMVSQFGINMLVPIGMMSALGVWLDKRFDTSFWTILLFFAGAIAGGQNVYRMAKQVFQSEEGQHGAKEQQASGEIKKS